MATIQKRGSSYLIRVSNGYDINGKQIIKPMTWKPDEGMTQRQIDKEVERQAVLFEEKVKKGIFLDGNMTFAEFVDRWRTDYAEKSQQPKTLEENNRMLRRIVLALGNYKMCKLNPNLFNAFYDNLREEGINKKQYYKPQRRLQNLFPTTEARRALRILPN